jgi:hypothetical protein
VITLLPLRVAHIDIIHCDKISSDGGKNSEYFKEKKRANYEEKRVQKYYLMRDLLLRPLCK